MPDLNWLPMHIRHVCFRHTHGQGSWWDLNPRPMVKSHLLNLAALQDPFLPFSVRWQASTPRGLAIQELNLVNWHIRPECFHYIYSHDSDRDRTCFLLLSVISTTGSCLSNELHCLMRLRGIEPRPNASKTLMLTLHHNLNEFLIQ